MKTQELPGSDVAREPFALRPGNQSYWGHMAYENQFVLAPVHQPRGPNDPREPRRVRPLTFCRGHLSFENQW